jgi:hypothetical protein
MTVMLIVVVVMTTMMVMECEDNESRILKDICTLRDYVGGDKEIHVGALNLLAACNG